MADRFDIAILGAGPAGEHAAYAQSAAGRSVLVIERELIGGECTNWACIPTKTLLRPTEVRGESRRAAGVHEAALDWSDLSGYRDYMTSAGNDSARVANYERMGVTFARGGGRLAGPGTVEVDGRRYEAERILISTGSDPVIPPVPGLRESGYWTNREVAALETIPASAVIVGGGPVGIELSQFLARFGCEVALVQGADRLAEREDERISELLEQSLTADGISVRTGSQATRASVAGDDRVVELDDGSSVRGERLVVAVGRRPRSAGIGLETIGVELNHERPGPIPVDEHCRVADGVWAAGDCTGVMLFTHLAKYQARIAMADMAGRPVPADYRAIPRVIFTDPEVAAVGLSAAQARKQGLDVAVCRFDLPSGGVARTYTYERDPHGEMELVFDRRSRTMVGAWAVAPLASEWIHEAVLAIRARIPYEVLVDTVPQFPSFSEAYLLALLSLEL
ncbi:MAG TPA: NAD(P)/FAD-dependent oxidoreductase [Solirubrobacteraceae bacterium]|nr:NAD(P)/FAD-dependent oxidoreductase [Solirubrobacteraceae bacterium]